ncbi:uncharacterized protein LOC121640173 isoform X2 [Melanotaenia boesemani]|uniref:uncharacterized protein LOC121640173 isoform X2 n=1 Tax=Melanotaenia boesemani TaxID=1250792 RepID=UPI001C053381|nr:uncharacterized protein LOC121640173 isoform X2 [Melanotaenia boesemani]
MEALRLLAFLCASTVIYGGRNKVNASPLSQDCHVITEHFKKNKPLTGSNVILQCITNISITKDHIVEYYLGDRLIFTVKRGKGRPENKEDKSRMCFLPLDEQNNGTASLTILYEKKYDEGNFSCCLKGEESQQCTIHRLVVKTAVEEDQKQAGLHVTELSTTTRIKNETSNNGDNGTPAYTVPVVLGVVGVLGGIVGCRRKKKGCKCPWTKNKKEHDEEGNPPQETLPMNSMDTSSNTDSTRLRRSATHQNSM